MAAVKQIYHQGHKSYFMKIYQKYVFQTTMRLGNTKGSDHHTTQKAVLESLHWLQKSHVLERCSVTKCKL